MPPGNSWGRVEVSDGRRARCVIRAADARRGLCTYPQGRPHVRAAPPRAPVWEQPPVGSRSTACPWPAPPRGAARLAVRVLGCAVGAHVRVLVRIQVGQELEGCVVGRQVGAAALAGVVVGVKGVVDDLGAWVRCGGYALGDGDVVQGAALAAAGTGQGRLTAAPPPVRGNRGHAALLSGMCPPRLHGAYGVPGEQGAARAQQPRVVRGLDPLPAHSFPARALPQRPRACWQTRRRAC